MSQQPKKSRFDTLDVQAMVGYLQSVVIGQRVVNIYNDSDNGSLFWFKFDQLSEFLVVESGVRFHTTRKRQQNASNTMPSPFCMKLRKHIRGHRLEQVQQLGNDRVVLFQFGVDNNKHCLILELYSKGNIILVDANQSYTILALLRTHVYNTHTNDEDETNGNKDVAKVQVGHVYPVTLATTTTTAPAKEEGKGGESASILLQGEAKEAYEWAQQQLMPSGGQDNSKQSTKKKKNSRNLKWLLLQATSGVSHYGPALLEHCIRYAELSPTAADVSLQDVQQLQTSLRQEGPRVLDLFRSDAGNQPGYILYRLWNDDDDDNDGSSTEPSPPPADGDMNSNDNNDNNIVLEEFQPHLLLLQQQQPRRKHWKYEDFSQAVDVFFSRLVDQKRLLKAHAMEQAAVNKLKKIQQDQEDRVTSLQEEQEIWQKQAVAVQLHAEDVDNALTVINSALDSGMDWDQLHDVIRVEQEEKQNPIALLIQSMDLENNSLTLRLENDEGEMMDVAIELGDTAHGNANRLFAKYRASKDKAQKTLEASKQALEAAEANAQKQLEEAKSKQASVATVQRKKTAWYEKFRWFITSDNYLAVAGRDAHQNELLVKRYLRPGDGYLHADVHGASSCVIRAKRRRIKNNQTELVALSQRALQEAGNFTICHSSAWSKKMVFSAWWVEAHQVSKTAPTGEFLTLGSFMIRGKKNFLPPCQLEMGMGVLFRLGDDDSIARHVNDRRDFALMMDLESQEEIAEDVAEEDIEPNPDNVSDGGTVDTDLNDIQEDGEHSNSKGLEGNIEPEEDNSYSKETEATSANSQSNESPANAKWESGGNDQLPNGDKSGTEGQKRGLSAKDRKLIKKYGSLEEAERILAERESEKQISGDSKGRIQTSNSLVTNGETEKRGKVKRGKKGKMKKLMKYADQDDEDRELAMQALQGGEKAKKEGKRNEKNGTSAVQEKVAADTVAVLASDAEEISSTLDKEVREILAECISLQDRDNPAEMIVRWDKLDGGTLEQLRGLSLEEQVAGARRLLNLKTTTRVDNFSSSLGGIVRTIKKYGHENLKVDQANADDARKRKTKQEKEAEDMKWKQTLAEEGVVDVDLEDGAIDDTLDLAKLTGKPHADDTILYAVPVCAPYQTLSQYTYRVKLTPGGMKRGKAAKQCLELFQRDDHNKGVANHQRYKEFIKKVPDNDWMQTICSDVKITTAGANKVAKNNKASNKKSKKKK